METFVRQSFYVSPPAKDAAPEQWQKWLRADRKEAIKAKRQYTKSIQACDLPADFQANSVRKIDGVWKSVTAIGYTGNEETGRQEPTVKAVQEREIGLARYQPRITAEQLVSKRKQQFWAGKRYARKMTKLHR